MVFKEMPRNTGIYLDIDGCRLSQLSHSGKNNYLEIASVNSNNKKHA
jgi:hypothetical protein